MRGPQEASQQSGMAGVEKEGGGSGGGIHIPAVLHCQ